MTADDKLYLILLFSITISTVVTNQQLTHHTGCFGDCFHVGFDYLILKKGASHACSIGNSTP